MSVPSRTGSKIPGEPGSPRDALGSIPIEPGSIAASSEEDVPEEGFSVKTTSNLVELNQEHRRRIYEAWSRKSRITSATSKRPCATAGSSPLRSPCPRSSPAACGASQPSKATRATRSISSRVYTLRSLARLSPSSFSRSKLRLSAP